MSPSRHAPLAPQLRGAARREGRDGRVKDLKRKSKKPDRMSAEGGIT
eukprot:COSAG06_NODE_49522_length_325_cov_0.407080_1_plen_46_part_01